MPLSPDEIIISEREMKNEGRYINKIPVSITFCATRFI